MQEFEVSPEQAKEWRAREGRRFCDGTYTPLPSTWTNMRWFYADDGYRTLRYPDHFAHVSIDKVAMVAFTESEQKGVRDRQTRTSPGKYLTKFFGDVLSGLEIQALATQMGAQYNDDAELLFAVTADEFEEVYLEGPSSCMSHGADDYQSSVHPVRVYAGHDLQLAYLKRQNRITARSLCWPEKKVFGRVYGDIVRMEHSLLKAGYQNGSLSGAKITRLMDGGDYVIPYLDYLEGAVDKGDHLVLSDGSIKGQRCCPGDRQNGLSGNRISCTECGEGVDEDDCQSDNGNYYCASCYNERYGYCERTEESVPRDELEEVRTRLMTNGGYRVRWWGEYARNEYAFYCEQDNVWYSNEQFTEVEIRGRTWGPAAVENHAVMCEGSEEYVHLDDSVTLEDGTTWSMAHFERYGIEIDGKLYDHENLPDGVEAPERIASPTVVCPAQTEMPLVPGLHLKPSNGRWLIMDGDKQVDPYAYLVKGNAEERMTRIIAERAAAMPIVVGCMVMCINNDHCSSEFTVGALYKVTRVYADSSERISIERDDCGAANGWMMEKFRFHSMPVQTGLHIRHEPDASELFPYRLYDGEEFINGWHQHTYANAGLERFRRIHAEQRQPEEVA